MGSSARAVKRMISLLNESVSDLTNAGERGASKTEFVLDGDRTSRIAFLSGERGTGKTTVLLSIKEAWNLARNLHSPGPPGGYLGEEDRESWNTLAGIANRLVWLDPLDMEPLPPSTNLLAAVLARIDRASKLQESPAGLSGETRERMSAVSPLDPGSGYQDAMFDLQELETSVAIAWDGNVAGRAGSVDPDTFAVEVMRAEMVRLGLNPNVNRVLDGLARHVFGRGAIRDPLFVLAIDDFDLNPSRSFELIRLLRTVSTPRLFTIILGDLRVAEAVFCAPGL